MIEKTIREYLKNTLSVPVGFEKSATSGKKYVLLDKTGGSEESYIRRATVAIQSCATSLLDAATLNEEVKTAMEGFKSHTNVSSVKLNTDYNYTNPETKEYRYQAVFDLVYME